MRIMAGHGKTIEKKIATYRRLLYAAELWKWESLIPFYRGKIEELTAELKEGEKA